MQSFVKTICFTLSSIICFSAASQETMREILGDNRTILDVSNYNNQNINHADATFFQNEKRATTAIFFPRIGDTERPWGRCTGCFFNTAIQSGELYITTAYHCMAKTRGDNFDVWITIDYEMSDAAERGNDAIHMDVTRAFKIPVKVLVRDIDHDIAFLEIDKSSYQGDLFSPQGPLYAVYASGWTNLISSEAPWANISHPIMDHKKFFSKPKKVDVISQVASQGFARGTGIYYKVYAPWNGIKTSPEQGSSGSSLLNANGRSMGILSVQATGIYDIFSSLSNSWYLKKAGQNVGMQKWLDPNSNWLSSIPGGALADLIPVDHDFNLTLHSGEVYSTPLPQPNVEDPFENMLFISPELLFNGLGGPSLTENILGLKLDGELSDKVIMTVSAVGPNSDRESLLYGTYVNETSDLTVAGFRQSAWDRMNPPNDIPTGFNPPLGLSTDYKNAIVQHARRDAQVLNKISRVFDEEIPVIVKLMYPEGSVPAQVQAISYPGDVPINALQLFRPEEVAKQFNYYKYQSSRGKNSNSIYIDQLATYQGGEVPDLIPTGNNGGYLNLVNPNYKIGPVKTSYIDDNNSVVPSNLGLDINLHNQTNETVSYSVWIDYFNTDALGGRKGLVSENDPANYSYNFVEDATIHGVELFASGTISGTTINIEEPMPTFAEISLAPGETRMTRMRVSVKKGTTPPTQGGIFAEGEVEDYLIEIKAPTREEICELERPSDYDVYAEGKVMPYCGAGGYREAKDPLVEHYQTTSSGNLIFETGKQPNVRFANAKAIASWYNGGIKVPLDQRESPAPDPSALDFDQNLMAISTTSQEQFPDELIDQDLKMDIYYPLPKEGKPLDDLLALPLIIYHFGGAFVWNTRQSSLTEATCRWFASRGYVVAAIDYRVGAYGYDIEISKRAMIRAWQDSRAAVKWWRMDQNQSYTDDIPLWKIDPDRIYANGHSAGGITSQANLYLTKELFDQEIVAGGFLKAVTSDYQWQVQDESEIQTYHTYDLRDYEPIPCLEVNGVNLCDELSKSTDPTYGSYMGNDSPLAGAVAALLAEYESNDGRVNKAASFAGGIAKIDWMFHPPFLPSTDIHHTGDLTVPYGQGFPIVGWFGTLLNTFTSFQVAKLFGGGAMKEAWDGATTRDVFELLALDQPEQGGMTGDASYHVPQYKFRNKYDDYLAGEAPALEDKIMYYVDAFFTKDWAGGTGTRTAETAASNEENSSEEREDLTFNISPNPASDQVNILMEVGEAGSLKLEIMDMQGKQVYEMERDRVAAGHQMITIRNLNLPAALYVLVVEAGGVVMRDKLLVE